MSSKFFRTEPLHLNEGEIKAIRSGSYKLTKEQISFLESQQDVSPGPISLTEKDIKTIRSGSYKLTKEQISFLKSQQETD